MSVVLRSVFQNSSGVFLLLFCLAFRVGCLTKRAPDAGDSATISSSFTRLIIFPVGRRSTARPSAGNANRWAFNSEAISYPYICSTFCRNQQLRLQNAPSNF